MSDLFQYQTFDCTFERQSKSVTLAPKEETSEHLNAEFIFELETFMSWLVGHLEVQTVIIRPGKENRSFMDNPKPEFFCRQKASQVNKILAHYRKLVIALFHMPQTLIVDFGTGASGLGIELSLPADVRLMRENGLLHFDFLDNGLLPCSGGMGLLSFLTTKSLARNWVMASAQVGAAQLQACGFIAQSYSENERDKKLADLKNTILAQSPVERIQAKRAHLEDLLPILKRVEEVEDQFFQASFAGLNWQKAAQAQATGQTPHFADPRDMAKVIKAQG